MKYSPSTKGFYTEAIHGEDMPSDVVDLSDEEYQALYAGLCAGKMIVVQEGVPTLSTPALTQEETIGRYEAALDNHLDSVARQHRYNSRITFALRAGYPGPFHAEGVAFATWMDACNAQAYQMLEDVLAGRRPLPTVDDFLAALPEFVMP